MDLGGNCLHSPTAEMHALPLECSLPRQGYRGKPARAAAKAREADAARHHLLDRAPGRIGPRAPTPQRGLLGGMMEFPSTDWREGARESDVPALSRRPPHRHGMVSGRGNRAARLHPFPLELTVLKGYIAQNTEAPPDTRWSTIDGLSDLALPTVMKKVAEKAVGSG